MRTFKSTNIRVDSDILSVEYLCVLIVAVMIFLPRLTNIVTSCSRMYTLVADEAGCDIRM